MQREANPIHVNHLENRLLYAQRIIAFFDRRVPDAKAANMAAMNRATWEHICRLAGEERMPSDATISTIVGMVRGRELAMEALKGALSTPAPFLAPPLAPSEAALIEAERV